MRKESAVVPCCRCRRTSDFPIVFSTFLAFHIVPEMAPLQATRVDDRKRDLTTGRTGRTGRFSFSKMQVHFCGVALKCRCVSVGFWRRGLMGHRGLQKAKAILMQQAFRQVALSRGLVSVGLQHRGRRSPRRLQKAGSSKMQACFCEGALKGKCFSERVL